MLRRSLDIYPDNAMVQYRVGTTYHNQSTELTVRLRKQGTDEETMARVGPGTRVIRLDGQRVLPGFVDAHVHLLEGGFELLGPDLHGTKDVAEFAQRLRLDFDGAFVHDAPLSWIARDSSKPGRAADAETWVLHAAPAWTQAHLGAPGESIVQELLTAFRQATGADDLPQFATAHRWRYALPTAPLTDRSMISCWCATNSCSRLFTCQESTSVRISSVSTTISKG